MMHKCLDKLLKITLIILVISPTDLYGSDIYYEKKKEGWFWYEKIIQPKKKKKEEKKKVKIPVLTRQQRAVKKIEQIKQKTRELLSTAVIEPTEENLVAFMAQQKELLDMSDKFRKIWELALLSNPELDYTAYHPVSTIALQAKNREQYVQNRNAINQIGTEAGIYFIFSSTCPFCVEQAKILKRFENNYGMSVYPLTINGEGLNEYPYPDNGRTMADRLSIGKTPTLILAYPQEDKMIPLASGLVTEDELIHRILILDQKKGEI